MKKTVLTFGLISGAMMALFMLATVPFMDNIGFDKGAIVGYTAIVLSFLLVFFGIRSYRENVGDGAITFGRAFTVGILITLISSLFYVVTWEIVYFFIMTDFAEKYTAYMVAKMHASGANQQAIDATLQQMKSLKAMMDNPLLNAALAFTEPFPVGLIITVISSVILRRRTGRTNAPDEPGLAQSRA